MRISASRLLSTLLLACIHPLPTLGEEYAGVLLISTRTKESVAGEYRKSATSERGIRFVSGTDSLAITTLDGAPLLIADEPIVEGTLRVVNIAGDTFVQHRVFNSEAGESQTVDYAVPASWESTTKNTRSKLHVYMRSLNEVGMEARTRQNFQNAIKNLLMQPEVDLIKPAAFALGAQEITGREFPSILPFYLAALRLQKIKNEYFMRGNASFIPRQDDYQTREQLGSGDDDCLEECPPCPDYECLGMCGYGCICWKFVCGDCCYHLGCYEHDLCCRKQFISTRCLFPFGLQCESEYDC